MHVDLDAVPLRDETLRPEEILMSESQERMMAVVEPAKVERFMEICARWEIPATVIGAVTDTRRLVMTWRGETIVDIPPVTAADEGPVYNRPLEPPKDLGALQSDTPGRLTRPSNGDELRRTVLWLAGAPNLASKTWVTSQYDRYVLGNTVMAMPENAGVVRIDDESGLGIALSLDGNGRYTRLDPYSGAQLALSEAYRNVAATGARPLAVTNCLNFGSPEDPGVMWQFARAVEGLADGCQYLGIPVTGGNVSFYNQTGETPINPTPVIGVLGVHDDVRRRVNMSLTSDGATLALLGETREEFGGSEWAHVVYGHLGGLPPLVDLKAEAALASVMVAAIRDGLVTAVHDLSDGGLSQALVESCLRGGLGARITLPGDPFVTLFSESVARAMVAVRPGAEARLAALCESAGVPVTQLGVAGGDALNVTGRGPDGDQQELFSVPCPSCARRTSGCFPATPTDRCLLGLPFLIRDLEEAHRMPHAVAARFQELARVSDGRIGLLPGRSGRRDVFVGDDRPRGRPRILRNRRRLHDRRPARLRLQPPRQSRPGGERELAAGRRFLHLLASAQRRFRDDVLRGRGERRLGPGLQFLGGTLCPSGGPEPAELGGQPGNGPGGRPANRWRPEQGVQRLAVRQRGIPIPPS